MSVVFVPRETARAERRVAAVPDTVARLVALGHRVGVEPGAGRGSFFEDDAYARAGATLLPAEEGWRTADVVLRVAPPAVEDAARLREGASLVAFLFGVDRPDVVRALAARRVSVFAMDAVPRTTRAQKADALTSQASLAGYKAVVLAAAHLPKVFPLQMTPAGTIRPARVVVLGAGVAGLQAIATARRLGAVVEVSDVRPEAKEQALSLGASWIEGPTAAAPGAGGYATEQDEAFRRRQQEALADRVAAADVVVTTALVPGRPAPRLVTAATLARMRPGSVVVDLAAERGGNVEGTVPGRTVSVSGVTVVGETDLASSVATHASDQYARNVLAVVADATKAGTLRWDLADDTVAGALVVHEGEVRDARLRAALGLAPAAPPPPPRSPDPSARAAAASPEGAR